MAFAVWFTGLPGSGKTVIASRCAAILKNAGIEVKILQLDEIRKVLTPEPKYTDDERNIVYLSLVYMAKLLVENGVNVFIDATANKRKYRDTARSLIPQFAEIFIRCPLDICMEREANRKAAFSPKGIYIKAARAGANVPGVNVPYEEPIDPIVVIDSDRMRPDMSAEKAVNAIISFFRMEKHEN
jgi:adenylylsulfate kinase